MSDKNDEEQIQTAIRIPRSWLERFDKLAEQQSNPGMQISRADVHRQAIHRGLFELEKKKSKKNQ
jgi:predicted DNA-binding protein